MKKVKMMMLDDCPYCEIAFKLIDELKRDYEKYRKIEIEVIEESKESEKTNGFDYWYVPTYFVDNQKIHEGVPSYEKLQEVLEAALHN